MKPSDLETPDPALVGVLGVLAEKMGLTPDEFAASTVVIERGHASVMRDLEPGAPSVVATEPDRRA